MRFPAIFTSTYVCDLMWFQDLGTDGILCTRNLCPGRGDAAGGTRKRENAKTRKRRKRRKRQARKREETKTRKRRKRENGKNAKTRKRAKQESRFCRKQKNTTINYRTSNQRRTEMGKAQEDGNAKTRNRQKVFSFSSCLVLHRSSPFRSTLNTKVITALGICKVCTEAVHSVALGTRTLSQLWAHVSYVPKQCKILCTEAELSAALWPRRFSHL